VERLRYDVVIVGGGAAGLSGALVLGRSRRRVAVVDAGEPRNAPAARMQAFLSRDGMAPGELLAAGRAEVTGYGVELIRDRVVEAQGDAGWGFMVGLGSGRVLAARRLLVATGVSDELPDIPGARELWGSGLLHCPYCHGWEVRDQPLGVLGTSPGAVQHALLVRQWSADVIYFAGAGEVPGADLAQLAARGVRVVAGEVTGLVVQDGRLAGVRLDGGRVVPRAAVFIRPRNVAHDDGLLAGLGCAVDADGLPVVGAGGRTSVAGVWAAGNIVNPRAQVITAAGDGAAAAMAINADLVADDVARAAQGSAGDPPAAGTAVAEGPLPAPEEGPFPAAMEAHIARIVAGDRRHGLP
jgi:thioredoxin reductase